jgi:hypothetical protein
MPSVEERLAYLEGRVGDQATAFIDVRSELRDVRTDLRELRGETNAGFSSLRNAIDSRFAAADAKVTWVIGIQVGMLLMIAGAALGFFFK